MKLSLILLFVFISTVKSQFTGRCTANPVVCCKGVNSACRRGDCYCDEYCTANKDCCPDFGIACNGGATTSATTAATTRQPNVSTPHVSSAVPVNVTQNTNASSVPFTTQNSSPTTSRLSSTSSSQTSPVALTTSSGSSIALQTSTTSLSASSVTLNNSNNLLLNISPSTTLRTSVMLTATTAQTYLNAINGTATNTVATMQLVKVTSSGIPSVNNTNSTASAPTMSSIMITPTGTITNVSTTKQTFSSTILPESISTSGVLSNASSNIPSVNKTNSTTLAPTMSSIIITPSTGAITNVSTTKQTFSLTILPANISTSGVLSNASSNIPSVNNTNSTTLAPTMSSIIITPSTGAITNVSTTKQTFSSTILPANISTSGVLSNISTSGVLSNASSNIPSVNNANNTISAPTMSSIMISPSTGATTNLSTTKQTLSSTILPGNISTSNVLSSVTSNLPSVNNATSTLKTTSAPTVSSIMITPSTGAISNLSTTMQMLSSTIVPVNILTSNVLSNVTSNLPSVNNATNTLKTTSAPTVPSIMITPFTGAITNLSTTMQMLSSTILPGSISTSNVLSNASSNIPSVNNATSTSKTTSAPTVSSIMIISPSTGAITNLSITMQTLSSTILPTTISTTTGVNSGGTLTTDFTAARTNGLSISTNGIVSSFGSSITTSSSNDISSSRLNNVSTSFMLSSISSNVPSAISTTTTLRTAIQSTASAASISNVSTISTSTATITLQSSNGTGMSGNVSSSNSAYNISNFVTSINSARTTELPIVSSNISTSNIVRTTSIVSNNTSNTLATGASTAGVNTTASGVFYTPTNNLPTTINTTTAPIVSLRTAVASSSISGLKINSTSPSTTMQTSATSSQFTAKSSSDTSSNLTTTGISVTSSIKTTGLLTAIVGSTSSLGSNGSSVTTSDFNSKPPLGITEISSGKTTIGNTSNTLIPNVTRSNVTAFTILSNPAQILGILSNATSSVMTPVVSLRPTGVSALPSTSSENNTASTMQIVVSTISASGKTPDTYSNPVTIALNTTLGIRVTGPPSAGGVSNDNSMQTTPAVIGTNASSISGLPIPGTKTSPSPIVSSSVLVFNATMSLRPSGGLPVDITTRAVTAPNTIANTKINETIQTTAASASSGSLSTSRIPNNSTQGLPASSMEATNPATVMPTQSIMSTGIVYKTSISPPLSIVNITTSTGLTSTIATQSNISNLLTTFGNRVSTSLTNQTTGVTVSSTANSTAEPTFSTLNRLLFSANTNTNYLLSQGASSSTAVPTVQRVAADPLMPQNKSSDLVQVTYTTYTTPTGLSTVNASRPVNMSVKPMDNGTQTLYLPPLSQSSQATTESSVSGAMKGNLSTTSGASGNSPSTNLLLETTASYTTSGSKSATISAKRKNLISILWSLIFPALVSIKNSYQTASRLNVTTESATYEQNPNYNQTGMTDLNPAAINSSTEVQKQDSENNIEIVHVSYWRIKGGGSLSKPDGELREDTQDTDIMESLSALKDKYLN